MKSNILSFEDYRVKYAKWMQTKYISKVIERGDFCSIAHSLVYAYFTYLTICGEYQYEKDIDDLIKLLEVEPNFETTEEQQYALDNFEEIIEKIMNKY